MDSVMSIIRDFGFPVAVCCVSFWYINKISTDHKKEVDALTAAINEMRVVFQELLDKFGG